MPQKADQIRNYLEGHNFTRSGNGVQSAHIELGLLLDLAKRAMPRNQHVVSADLTRVDSKRASLAGVNGTISLTAMLTDLLDSEGRIYRAPLPTAPAGEAITLDWAVIQSSRVLQAGCRLIVMPESAEPVTNDAGVPAFQETPIRLVNINPANVAAMTLDGNGEGLVTASAFPVAEAAIDPNGWTQRAVRFELPRSMLKAKGMDQVAFEAMTAIALGIANAADQEVLAAINATTPGAFSLAAAALAGLRFDELRAVAGTNGSGVATDAGKLYVAGIPAELSGSTATTIVGAFDRCGLAVSDEITLLAERTKVDGSLVLTAWVDMQPLLPEPGKFWSVA